MFSARRTTVSSQVLMRRQHRRLRMERLQERWMLATVYWASHEVNPKVNNPVSVFAADFDGDGDADIVSASYDDGKIAWFENTDGRGAFGPPHARSPPRQRRKSGAGGGCGRGRSHGRSCRIPTMHRRLLVGV